MVTEQNIYDKAYEFKGWQEFENRKQLIKLFKAAGLDIDPYTTPWCAAFVNMVLNQVGLKGTGKLNARSFLTFGEKLTEDRVYPGDIVILKRGTNPWQGHVAFFHSFSDDPDYIYLLGGNQGDMVKVGAYRKSDVLGYRCPINNC